MPAPNFSPYPWHVLPRRSPREAAIESAIARWLGVRRGLGPRTAERFGEIRVRVVGAVRAGPLGHHHVACCDLRRAGETIAIHGSAALVRAIARRLLGGPDELDAARPLGLVERATWALAVAAAIEDLGIAGEVWPSLAAEPPPPAADSLAIELVVDALGVTGSVLAIVPTSLVVRAPPPRALPAWVEHHLVEAPIVVARCALPASAVGALAVRDLVTVEPVLDLEIFGGVLGLRAAPNAVVAEVATEYVRRDMALDDAHVELAVTLGTIRIPLRQALGLAIGEIIQLGRPLAGPFEVRAAGRVVGHGELVDVDGELAVRIVSLEEK